MEIFVADNYEQMSIQAAECVKQLMQPPGDLLICTASGDTPAGLYKELVQQVSDNQLDISTWNFVGLDEWVGMNGNDEGSCRYYLDLQLFAPVQIPENRISFFDGTSVHLQKECEAVENFITEHHGLDVVILGLGINGHVGMNEPGTSPALRSHVTGLDPVTQKIAQKYFKRPVSPTHGITLGLATIMNAKNIVLLVSGGHKAEITRRVLQDEISEQLPASLLRNHKNLKVYLDKDAASLIDS